MITRKQAIELGIISDGPKRTPRSEWRDRVLPMIVQAIQDLGLNSGLAKEYQVDHEVEFAHGRKWRFDFAIPKLKLAFEFEGVGAPGQKSRHTSITGYANDCEKYSIASGVFGWRVVRLTALMTRPSDDRARRLILASIEAAYSGRINRHARSLLTKGKT